MGKNLIERLDMDTKEYDREIRRRAKRYDNEVGGWMKWDEDDDEYDNWDDDDWDDDEEDD